MTEMDPYEMVAKVRELLADPVNWNRGAFAKDRQGNAVGPRSPEAVSWCLAGAVRKVAGSGWAPGDEAYHLMRQRVQCDVSHFNDQAKHHEVLALLDGILAERGKS